MANNDNEECEKCRGTGWVVEEREGKEMAVRCECYNAGKKDSLEKGANLPKRYTHCRLSNFEDRNDSLTAAKVAAQKLIDEFPVIDSGLLFLGPCGVGKTHLAVAILRELMETKGANCYFQDFRDLLRKIKDSYNPVSQSSELQVLTPVLRREVVVLDDLGASRTTDWVRDTLGYIINTRYNNKNITLITSNYPDKAQEGKISLDERIGYRLRSRLYEMCKVVKMEGKDYREEIKQADYRFDV